MKKFLKIIGVLFLLIIITIILFVYNTSSQFKKTNQGELVTDVITDTISFTYSSSGHILLTAKINGNENDYKFILDSGASNFIFEKFQKENKLDNNGYAIGRNSSGSIFFSKIRKIDSLKLGNLKFININAKETEFNHDCSDDIYGLIGIGVMRHLIWNIDFKNQLIIVSKNLNELKLQDNKIEIPLNENKYSHHISVSLKFRKNNKSTSVLVDLGNSGTLSLKESRVLKDLIDFKSKKIFGIGSNGLADDKKKQSEEKLYLLDSIYFGGSTYFTNNLPVITSPKGLNLLGLGFFKKYKTTISWFDKKLILEPYDSIQTFNKKTYGFSTKYDKEENKVVINSIIEKSAASNSKLPLKSEVLSINNQSLDNMKTYCEYKTIWNSGDSVKIKIKYKDSIKDFLIVKDYLFN